MKKTRQTTVHFTEEEWEQLKKSADESGMKVGTYIQTMALHGRVVKFDFSGNEINKELININLELNRIGTNINQVTHKVNSVNKVYQADVVYLKKQVDGLKKHYLLVLDSLGKYMATFSDAMKEFLRKRV